VQCSTGHRRRTVSSDRGNWALWYSAVRHAQVGYR